MRRISFIKILVCIVLINLSAILSGCTLFNVDKNQNSYKIQPIDFIPVESLESNE